MDSEQDTQQADFASAFIEGRDSVAGSNSETEHSVAGSNIENEHSVAGSNIETEHSVAGSNIETEHSVAGSNIEITQAGTSQVPQTLFYIKRFQTNLKKQSIILQSVNGPCPLIAIVNCLLLQQRLTLSEDCECISASSLCSLLGNYLLDRAQKVDSHSEQYILDCLERFVQIQTGIDINVKFNSVEGFEYTPELSLFDLAQIRLIHGWVIDPQDKFLSSLVGDLTYNQLVEKTMEMSGSSDSREVSESLVLKELLESSQLTVHGICEINSSISSGDLVVLFRNNHFSTITKQHDRLYVLVTDIGWAEQELIVWETLDSTCNNTSFVDGQFNSATASVNRSAGLTDQVRYYTLLL